MQKHVRSEPHCFRDDTFRIFMDLEAFFLRLVICGRNVSFLSKVIPKNICCSVTGSPFRCRVGSPCGHLSLRNEQRLFFVEKP